MTQSDENPKDDKIKVEIDPDLEELIPGYLDNRRKDIEAILKAIGISDFETIQRMGHTMKGSGSGYGFDFISAIGMTLEESAKDKAGEKIQTSVNELVDYLDRVEVVYK